MRFLSKSCLLHCGALTVASLLFACSTFSPGVHLNPDTSTASGNAEDAPAKVQVITSSLLRSQKQKRDQQLNQDYQTLVGKPSSYKIEAGDILSIVVWVGSPGTELEFAL